MKQDEGLLIIGCYIIIYDNKRVTSMSETVFEIDKKVFN